MTRGLILLSMLIPAICFSEMEYVLSEPTRSPYVQTFEPTKTIEIWDADDSLVGKISWEDGEIKFEGNVDESAKIFFELLIKKYIMPEQK